MHGVTRSSEPSYFEAIRCRYDCWSELYDALGDQARDCRSSRPAPCCTAHLQGLDGEAIRREIRNSLRRDFSGVCGYCEQDCSDTVTVIEHFRPRRLFPDDWITWTNLVYACQRCDNRKGDRWPGPADDPTCSYVSPSVTKDQQPAENFFEHYVEIGGETTENDLVPGQISPSLGLSPTDWWRADQTILGLDLNSDYDPVDARLPELRTDQLDFVLDEIGDPTDNWDRTEEILRRYSQPDQPFSSYISSFARSLGIQVR